MGIWEFAAKITGKGIIIKVSRNLIIILNSSNDEIGMWGLIDNKKVIDHGQGKPPIAHNVYDTLLVLPWQFIRVYPQ